MKGKGKSLMLDNEKIDEVSVSDSQRDFFNLVLKCKTEGDCGSEKIKKAANNMSIDEIEDFAYTKGKLPKKKSKRESIDEKKLLSLIKEKENPRMTKKGLVEYIKSTKKKEVIKSTTKTGMVSEALHDNLGKHLRYFKGEKGAIKKVMKYLEMIRQSGLENMHGAYPILNWSPDDLERYLYGKRMDLDSLDSDDRQYDVIKYMVDHKQEIRDILTRVALRKSEDVDDHSMETIQKHFRNAALEAFHIWVGIMSI